MKSRSILTIRFVNLLLGVAVRVYFVTTVLGRLDVEEFNDQVILTHGDVRLVINKSPWRLQIYHNSTGALVLSEATVADHRLGFGRWEGEYLDIYEGYLFRVGLITEWYHATNVLNWTHSEDDSSIRVTIATSDPKGRVISVHIGSFVGERQFSMNAMVEGEDASKSNRVHMGFQIKKEEGFYGFGERFDDCNQRGHRVGSWCEDGSFGLGMFAPDKLKLRVPKGELSTYAPMPLGISSEGYGLQMDTYYRTVFDLGKSTDNLMKLEQETNHLNITFFLGLTPCETFLMQANKNGKSLIPPLWEFAPWNQLDTEKAGVDQVTRAKQLLFDDDIPFSHNVRTIHFFPSGEERGQEDELKTANEELLAMGIKSTAYFNPTVAHSYEEFYSFCAVNNFFLTKENGLPYNFTYFTGSKNFVSMLDFTNGIMVKWYQEQMNRAVKTVGYHGWMYDYGEYTPPYSNASNGDNGLLLHNHYPLLYQQAAFDYFTRLDPDPDDAYAPDYVYYVRSGYLGSQKVTWAHWTGDPSSDWSFASGLPAQINAGINIGLSGMPFSGSDIGGFEWYVDSSPPDLELWSRWTEAGCFSGLMREQGNGTGFISKTHIFDWPEGTSIWRKYAKLRMQLLPYIYTQAHVAYETGLPLVRHHILHFPNDSTAVKQQQQYMFGETFLVAPVIAKNAREWNVYLPAEETWLDVGSTFQYEESDGRFRIGFSGFMQGSQTVKVSAPLDVTPLFIRCGSVIPVADPRVMTVNNATNSSVMTWQNLKHLRNLWIWVNENWTAKGWSWDNELYAVSPIASFGIKGINLSISGNAKEKFIHIAQIAAPWNGTYISSVYANDTTGNGVMLQMKQSWQELVSDEVMAGWYRDERQQTVWLKLEPAYTRATILTS